MNLMTFKIGVLGQAYNPDYTSRSMRPARPDILWQWRNMWGSISFVLQIHFMKYYLNLARSTKKFTGMFQQLRPKFQLLVGREINVCSNCLDFHSSLLRYSSNTLIFFQYFDRMFQLLEVGCSNCWEFRRVELSCGLIQQLSVESQKLGL